MVNSEHDATKCRGIHIARRVRGVSALIRWVRNRVWVGQCLEGGFVIDEVFRVLGDGSNKQLQQIASCMP